MFDRRTALKGLAGLVLGAFGYRASSQPKPEKKPITPLYGGCRSGKTVPPAAKSWHFFPGEERPGIDEILDYLMQKKNMLPDGLEFAGGTLCPRVPFPGIQGWDLYVEWRWPPEITERTP